MYTKKRDKRTQRPKWTLRVKRPLFSDDEDPRDTEIGGSQGEPEESKVIEDSVTSKASARKALKTTKATDDNRTISTKATDDNRTISTKAKDDKRSISTNRSTSKESLNGSTSNGSLNGSASNRSISNRSTPKLQRVASNGSLTKRPRTTQSAGKKVKLTASKRDKRLKEINGNKDLPVKDSVISSSNMSSWNTLFDSIEESTPVCLVASPDSESSADDEIPVDFAAIRKSFTEDAVESTVVRQPEVRPRTSARTYGDERSFLVDLGINGQEDMER